jgi:hypothetical protein
MKILILNQDNSIVVMSEEAQEVENGLLINDCVYPPSLDTTLFEVEVIPYGVEPVKYCYTEEKGFYENPNYKPYYSPEERIAMLEEKVAKLETKIMA